VERLCEYVVESHDERPPTSHTSFSLNTRFSAPTDGSFAHGTFFQCRVLPDALAKSIVEVSLRPSRLEGDLDDDDVPETGDVVPAFVVETSKKGCFLRLSRQVEGRTILKELCDGFLPDPLAAFPMGRLIVGKVKAIREAKKVIRGIKTMVDIDMRESVLIDEADRKLQFNDVEIGGKYKGTVMRIEEYGVFVRLDNSDVSGLVHKSECSDDYIKKLTDLYDPGDMVKIVVLKKNIEKRQIGFGMKASYFKNDPDSDDDESSSDDEAMDAENDDAMVLDDKEIASDDDDYVSKLSAKMGTLDDGDDEEGEEESKSSEDEDDNDDESSESSTSSDSDVKNHGDNNHLNSLDTDVGFDWNGGLAKPDVSTQISDDDDSDSSDSDDDENAIKSSHKSRRKQAQRRKEEQEISRRETALADGTADENPETAADFERLLAGDPNSSELWIRYMAFHLTMTDIPAARAVANRAFERIEFRLETEKLNVWCALLTLELKYGTDASLNATLDRACQHNNPKYVYLRLCEMMVNHQEGASSSSEARSRTDATFVKMCSKFRSKKKVWIAHLTYLLEQGRHEEAQKVMQRALLSLPTHKHVETLSRYATLAFAHGRPTTARKVFQGMLQKYPKRLDILFVYADQEMKHGHISSARSLFQRLAKGGDADLKLKLNDKQMKRVFKKWFTFEEAHGTETTQDGVKDAALAYIAQSKQV
jgi:rRNA biogenesis protein RRP5